MAKRTAPAWKELLVLCAALSLAQSSTQLWPEFRHGLNSDGRALVSGPVEAPRSLLAAPSVGEVKWTSGLVADDGGVYGVTDSDTLFAASLDGAMRCNVSLNGASSPHNSSGVSPCRHSSPDYSTRQVQPFVALLGNERLAVAVSSGGSLNLIHTDTCALAWTSSTAQFDPCVPPTLSMDGDVLVIDTGTGFSVSAFKLTNTPSLELAWHETLTNGSEAISGTAAAVASDVGSLYVAYQENRFVTFSFANSTISVDTMGLASCQLVPSAAPAVWVRVYIID